MLTSVSANTISCYRSVIVLLFMAQMTTHSIGQEVWTSDQFLNFDQRQSELPYQENLKFLSTAKGMPFVDQYEFRTETDEMEFEQQQFQFRFNFNSSEERKAYDRILAVSKDKYQLLQARYELDLWEEKYNNIIDLLFNQREMDLVIKDLELLADKQMVLRKILSHETKVEVSDWISNESEVFKVRSDSLDLVLRRKEISYNTFGSKRSAPRLDETGIIPFSKMKEIIAEIMIEENLHPDEGLALAEEDLADAEYKLELAEARRWLEFAQIQYQSEDKLSFQKELSLGVSVTIPNKNNNRVKKNDAVLELLEKNYDSRLEKEENRKELLTEEAKLLSQIDQLEAFKIMRENQNLDSIFESYSEKKIVSPLVLIDIKRSILRNDKEQLNLEKDIYESYINILTQKAAFLKAPRKNYLKD